MTCIVSVKVHISCMTHHFLHVKMLKGNLYSVVAMVAALSTLQHITIPTLGTPTDM